MGIQESRQGLLDTLSAVGLRAYPTNPEKLVPPCAVVWLGSPFLFDDDENTYSETGIRWEVDIVSGVGTNEGQTDFLLNTIGALVPALGEAGLRLEQVSQPVMTAQGNARYLTATASIVGTVELEG